LTISNRGLGALEVIEQRRAGRGRHDLEVQAGGGRLVGISVGGAAGTTGGDQEGSERRAELQSWHAPIIADLNRR
jgi:hypothetical protein